MASQYSAEYSAAGQSKAPPAPVPQGPVEVPVPQAPPAPQGYVGYVKYENTKCEGYYKKKYDDFAQAQSKFAKRKFPRYSNQLAIYRKDCEDGPGHWRICLKKRKNNKTQSLLHSPKSCAYSPAESMQIKIKMADNTEDQWGASVNFDHPWQFWNVDKVESGSQCDKKGIKKGDKIISVDDMILSDETQAIVEKRLMAGPACVIVIERNGTIKN